MKQPIKSIIIDYEKIVMETLCQLANKNYPDLLIIEVYQQSELFLSDFLKGNLCIDLLFLGIDNYPFTGIDLLSNMDKSNIPMNFNIILLGSFDIFTIKFFNDIRIDYLVKPIISKSFTEIITNWQVRHNKINTPQQVRIIVNHYVNNNKFRQQHLAIPNIEGFEILRVSKIIRCEGQRNYTKIVCKGKKEGFIVSKNLKELEKLLENEGFIRVHNSYIINPKYIIRILKSDGGILEMVDDVKIRITRNKEILMNYFLRY